MQYVTPQNLPGGWPVAPALYDPKIGMQSFQDGMEKLEFADHLGFDWISFSEHHYSYNSVAPHLAIMAAAMAERIKRARLAILAHILPLNNPVRVAEELAMLDYLTGGRLVVGFLRGTVNEDQTFSVNPTETRGRSLESMELILKALTEPQPFGWEGRFYQFRTVAVWPRPLQQPLPPTYVLTRSPESAEFAASHHLGLAVVLAWIRHPERVPAGGRRLVSLSLVLLGLVPGVGEAILYGAAAVGLGVTLVALAEAHGTRLAALRAGRERW